MPEIRYDITSGGYAVIATERAKRPSDWKAAQKASSGSPEHDPACPFCPGNEKHTPPEVASLRDSGGPDEPGWRVRVVPNKFPALVQPGSLPEYDQDAAVTQPADLETAMYWRALGVGAHEVVIESNSHNTTLAEYTPNHLKDVFLMLRQRITDLYSRKEIRYVQVFKNHGERAGASLAHPHFQIIALPIMPAAVLSEAQRQRDYESKTGRCLFCDLVEREIEKDVRVIRKTEDFAVLAPFASRFSFETLIVPRKHVTSLAEGGTDYFTGLAENTVDLFARYESMFASLPYNMVFHGVPAGPRGHRSAPFHAHIHVYPRLGTEAGLELGTGVHINPSPPEVVAKQFLQAGRLQGGFVHA
ncbi:MAG: galactose-1-phosphate uridylyltransferase [Bacillota bacterium]